MRPHRSHNQHRRLRPTWGSPHLLFLHALPPPSMPSPGPVAQAWQAMGACYQRSRCAAAGPSLATRRTSALSLRTQAGMRRRRRSPPRHTQASSAWALEAWAALPAWARRQLRWAPSRRSLPPPMDGLLLLLLSLQSGSTSGRSERTTRWDPPNRWRWTLRMLNHLLPPAAVAALPPSAAATQRRTQTRAVCRTLQSTPCHHRCRRTCSRQPVAHP